MIATILAVVAIGVVGWLLWAACRFVLPAGARRVAAVRSRIREDPADAVRTLVAANGSARARDQDRSRTAAAALADAEAQRSRIVTGFPGDRVPDHRVVVVTLLLAALWVVLVLASARIDLPIVTAVFGGDSGTARFAVLVLLGLPIVMSLLLGELLRNRGRIRQPALSLLAGGLVTVTAVVIAVLVALAPIRAEVEFRDRVLAAQQQVTQYEEDHDATAVRYARRAVDDLAARQRQSADFNQGLVLLAALGEATTGAVVPTAVTLLRLLLADGRVRRARTRVAAAERVALRRSARLYGRMAVLLRWAGVRQVALQRATAEIAAEQAPGRDGAAGAPVPIDRAAPPTPPTAPTTPAPAPPPPPGAPLDAGAPPAPVRHPAATGPASPPSRPTGPDDDRFDLS